MSGMAEMSKSPRRLYSVVRNLEWAFPATFVLGIIAVPLWSADMYAGMTLSLTAVALAFGLLRPRRVEKSLGVKGSAVNLELSRFSRLALSKWFKEHCGIDIENDFDRTNQREAEIQTLGESLD